MSEPSHRRLARGLEWWVLLGAALLIVFLWPPSADRSLAVKFVNWVVDPGNQLPMLPGPLPFGQGDDPAAVESHDLQTRMFDELYNRGGWTRTRLELKVARDPFNPSTERQLLIAFGVVTAFIVWKLNAAHAGSQQTG